MEMGCVDGDSTISLNWFGNSSNKTLRELHDRGVQPRRQVRSGRCAATRSFVEGSFRLNEILSIADVGQKESVTLTLASGRTIAVTPEHEILTTEGWACAAAIPIGAEILTNISKEEWDERKRSIRIPPIPPCALCGNPDSIRTRKSKYFGWCRSCTMMYVSKNSEGWTIDKDGYIRVGGHKDHPRCSTSGQVLEHILVMEKKLGRYLAPDERVHHHDRNPKNNEPENLELRTAATHHEDHEWFKNLRQDVFTPVPDTLKAAKSGGKRQMYDLMMRSPNNSFIANGIVVHNCGKSKVICDNAAYLHMDNKIKGQVVVAPKGVYMNWVENELPAHMSEAIKHGVAYWSSTASKDEKAAIKKLYQEGDFLRTLVVNVEALNTERAANEVVNFMQKFPSMITVDESTTIKNPDAKRTKILINVGKYAKYRRICTGNPIPNGPLDLYSQAEFLKQNQLGFANYYAFRNRFAVMQDQKLGSRSFKKVVGYREQDLLKRLMRQFSYIIKKEDCLDLPPKVYQVVDVSMGPRQAEAYNKMVEDAYVLLKDGSQVTAQMVITQLLRLHQISCGFLRPDGMPEVPFDEPNERMEALLNLLDQAPGKVIVWANYRYNIRQIVAGISEKYGKGTVVEYYGDTSDDDRRDAKRSFQDPGSPVKYMVSNPDTGKWGNTWTQATTVVYYSNSYNLEAREQSEDRAHRIGQVGAVHAEGCEPSVLYVDLKARGTVDERIIRVLKNKKKLTDEIVTSNWRWLIGEAA
jgi:hypothetical protein